MWPVLLEFQRVEHWSRDLLEEYSKLRNILSSMMFDGRSIVARKQQARCNCLPLDMASVPLLFSIWVSV